MAKTARFGLETFGGDVQGSIADNGGKFTGGDRKVIDRLLAAFEAHAHAGGSKLADPGDSPGLTLNNSGGSLDAGTTFHYVVTYIDKYGLESGPSDEASVTTAAAVAAPQAPGLTTEAGGTLDDGLYMYALSAHKGAGETPLGNISTITVTDLNTVRVSIPGGLPAGADQISIWRQGPSESWFTRIETQASVGDFVDDGSVPADPNACEPANQPQTENTTAATNKVTITAPTGELVQPTLAARWRIYRSTTSGVYGPQSLLAEVSDTTTQGGSQLVESYVDDGSVVLTSGSPPLSSRTLQPSAAVSGGGAGGGGGGGVLMVDSANNLWRLVAARDGAMITRAVPAVPGINSADLADPGFSMADANGTSWRVTVSTDGEIVTDTGSVAGEAEFVYGRGPDLPTFDGAVSYRLSIDTTGVISTLGQDDATAVEGFGVKRLFVQPTAPENPEDGDVWIDTNGLN